MQNPLNLTKKNMYFLIVAGLLLVIALLYGEGLLTATITQDPSHQPTFDVKNAGAHENCFTPGIEETASVMLTQVFGSPSATDAESEFDTTGGAALKQECKDSGVTSVFEVTCTDPQRISGFVSRTYESTCTHLCKALRKPCCGNKVTEAAAGETCDGAMSQFGTGAGDCRKPETEGECTTITCGDGIEDTGAGEECDDGGSCDGVDDSGAPVFLPKVVRVPCALNATNVQCVDLSKKPTTCVIESGDGCSDTCKLEICGNGTTDVMVAMDNGYDGGPFEECDDNAIDTAGCDNDCTFVHCGDGHLNEPAGEECDDAGYFCTKKEGGTGKPCNPNQSQQISDPLSCYEGIYSGCDLQSDESGGCVNCKMDMTMPGMPSTGTPPTVPTNARTMPDIGTSGDANDPGDSPSDPENSYPYPSDADMDMPE
jgi:hypothetical protein